MVPDFALRLQSMIRSMREVILPSIPKDQRLALDQASILLGNLAIMAAQHDRIFRYLMVELREVVALLRGLIEASADASIGGPALDAARMALAEAAPLVDLPVPDQATLVASARALKEAADDLLDLALTEGPLQLRRTASALVMAQSNRQIVRERVWVSAAGFELEPGTLPGLDEVL